MRYVYGLPIFVTFAPDEGHDKLMVRLSRTRRGDAVFANGGDPLGQEYCGSRVPPTHSCKESRSDDVLLGIPVAALISTIPSYEERKRLLARDPLASVEGFRTLVAATCLHLFGIRICVHCPDCNNRGATENSTTLPCQDIFGSNSTAEGGVFGRCDALFISIEAQKAGALHAHCQLFIQCLHQHLSLIHI